MAAMKRGFRSSHFERTKLPNGVPVLLTSEWRISGHLVIQNSRSTDVTKGVIEPGVWFGDRTDHCPQMPSWSAPNESQGRKMYDHKFNDNMVRAARAAGSEDI